MVLKLNTELFLLPDRKGYYLVYAPLRRLVMKLGPEQVNLLARLRHGRARKGDADSELVKHLVQCGVINGKPEARPPSLVGAAYAPTRVTLFLTNRCNLACRYCYAGGQTAELAMDEAAGRAAIDYAARNCRARKLKMVNVGFHGGGEPTMAWELLKALTAYGRETARRLGLEYRSGMSTNGCFSEERARWIAQNTHFVSVSMDGPPDIQDYYRPLRSGGPTSPLLRRTLRAFDRAKFPYSFQATITRETVREMPRIVRWFARHTRPHFLKFEPVSDCGRYFGLPREIPAGRTFARYFNLATDEARKRGVKLSFSGVRLWGSGVSYFCGAFAEPFNVTPDGRVSACYEAYSAETPYADVFLFGRWNAGKKRFEIDRRKLDGLRERNVYRLSPCRNCFCKYSCGGDCATRNFRRAGVADLSLVGARCDAIREITRYRLSRYVAKPLAAVTPPLEGDSA